MLKQPGQVVLAEYRQGVLRMDGRGVRGRCIAREEVASSVQFYQRLVQAGWSHRRTTLLAYLLMLSCSACAVLAFRSAAPGVQGLLLGWMAAVYLAIVAYVNARERRSLSKVEEG